MPPVNASAFMTAPPTIIPIAAAIVFRVNGAAFKRLCGLDDVGRNGPPFHEHILRPKGERHGTNELRSIFNIQAA